MRTHISPYLKLLFTVALLLTLVSVLAACNRGEAPTAQPTPVLAQETNTPDLEPSPMPTSTRQPSPTPTLPLPTATSVAATTRLPGAYVIEANAGLYDAPDGNTVATLPVGERVGLLAAAADGAWLQARYQADIDGPTVDGWVRAADVVTFIDVASLSPAEVASPPSDADSAAAAPTPTPAAQSPITSGPSATVLANRLNMRAGPGTNQRLAAKPGSG